MAIVGESGSGKSTLTNLLFKLYKPYSGKLLIDGVDTKFISNKTINKILGIVMQEPVLFNRSVYENIKYNTNNVGLEEVVAVSKKAKAYDFIIEGKFGRI